MPLTTEDLQTILVELIDAKAEWYELGLALGLSENDLKAFPGYQSAGTSLRQMLGKLLNQNTHCEWSDIARALRSPTVKRNEIAEKIEKKYCQGGNNEMDQEPPAKRPIQETQAPLAQRTDTSSSGSSSSNFDVKEEIKKHLETVSLRSFHYDLTSSGKHGKALIINIVKHPDPKFVREGSDVDRDKLEETLRTIGYEVVKRENLKGKEKVKGDGGEFGEAVYACAKETTSCDSFICCILAHGSQGKVMGADGVDVEIVDIARRLVDIDHLKGKPKIFFFQACQGSNKPPPVEYTTDDATEDSSYVIDAAIPTTLPRDSDFFYGLATSLDTVSIRHTAEGSVYIRALCGVIKAKYKEEDLATMVTRVHQIVAEKTTMLKGVPYKQQPQVVTTLRKLFYLTVP